VVSVPVSMASPDSCIHSHVTHQEIVLGDLALTSKVALFVKMPSRNLLLIECLRLDSC
jgi:hypothetical protein